MAVPYSPKSTRLRKILLEMIDLAMVDGDFAPAELELIKTVSEELGFTQFELDMIIGQFMEAKQE